MLKTILKVAGFGILTAVSVSETVKYSGEAVKGLNEVVVKTVETVSKVVKK